MNKMGDYLEKEANDKYVKRILEIIKNHNKKHPNRISSIKEIDILCGTRPL